MGVNRDIVLLVITIIICGFVLTISDAKAKNVNDDHRWSLEFLYADDTLQKPSQPFAFELFIDHVFVDIGFATPETILQVMMEIIDNHAGVNEVKLVLLNSSFHTFVIHHNNNVFVNKNEEIEFVFRVNHTENYSATIYLHERELTDFHFFYIEKSGGIMNLGDIRSRLDPIIENGLPFIVFFNGPNRPVIVTESTDITQFYNLLFTAITQPPVASEELDRVIDVLHEHLPGNYHDINLHFYFYFSDVSYNLLFNRFLASLIEHYFPEKVFGERSVYIMTDFDVSERSTEYNYINIHTNN